VNGGYLETMTFPSTNEKIRGKGPKFFDHFSQARLFIESLTSWEKQHLIDAGKVELGSVMDYGVKERMIEFFSNIDYDLATQVAQAIGVPPLPRMDLVLSPFLSPELSQNSSEYNTTDTRKVAFLIADGFNYNQINMLTTALASSGAIPLIVSTHIGNISSQTGPTVIAQYSFLTTKSVKFDAVVLVGGANSINSLKLLGDAREFVSQAFKHLKPIAALDEGIDFIRQLNLNVKLVANGGNFRVDQGVITAQNLPNDQLGPVSSTSSTSSFGYALWKAIASHRFYFRNISSIAA